MTLIIVIRFSHDSQRIYLLEIKAEDINSSGGIEELNNPEVETEYDNHA